MGGRQRPESSAPAEMLKVATDIRKSIESRLASGNTILSAPLPPDVVPLHALRCKLMG